MTADDVRELFEKHNEEYLEDERIQNPVTQRSDLNAFLRLNQICPESTSHIVNAAEHDEIFLEPSLEDLAEANITEDDVIYLIRCGVRLSDFDGLSMFV